MNIYSSISDITKSQPKPGGLCKVQFIPWEQVLVWPKVNPSTNVVDTDFVLEPGSVIYTLSVSDKDRMFKEELKSSESGYYYEQTITCRLAGYTRNNNDVLSSMNGHKFAVFFSDRYGDFKFIGNKDAGADFFYNYTTGDKTSLRSSLLTFSIESSVPAIIVDHFLPVVPTEGLYAIEYANEYL